MKNFHIALLFLFSSLIASGQKKNSEPFFFIQITDPQFGFIEDNKGFEQETILFEKAVAEINRLHPDFVVFTGDLVNKKEDRAQVNEFKHIAGKIGADIPVYYSPGNHDLGSAPGVQEIKIFEKDFGPDRFVKVHKNTTLIGINSCLIKNATPLLEDAQFTWLEKQLKKSRKSDHIIIFTHYSFFITNPDEAEAYFNIPPQNRQRYLALFTKYGVDAVFAGHLHNNGYGKSGNMEMITTSAVGKPLGKVPSGFRVVKVYPDRIENTYYPLKDVPEKIF